MLTYVSVHDVAVELGRPIAEPETSQVEAWLAVVDRRIRRRIPDLDAQIMEAGYAETARQIVVEVVAARVRNPDGLRSERVDDYYYDRGSSSRPSDLTLTQSDWAELGVVAGSGMYTIRGSFVPDWGR